ncbi:hypothetical protein MKX03_020480 [Papaver bracteatum]|nr:hypothetical protein MKX03_020480 [Papaver bracteatum]
MKPFISSASLTFRRKTTTLSPYLFTFLIFVFVLLVSILHENSVGCFLRQTVNQLRLESPGANNKQTILIKTETKKQVKLPYAIGEPHGDEDHQECDVFSGKWVYDEANRPLYEEPECPYIPSQLTCQQEGRPDKGYQHWRWQPHGCSLPSFMLEKLRGKRMLFVGDSLNRGQFTSMVCLLQKVIPEHAKSMRTVNDSLTVFTAKDYNATIEFYWAPFLLESNSDNAIIHRFPDRLVRKNSIDKHGQHWKGADILVFNTYIWWCTGLKFKLLSREWGGEPNGNCLNQTTPIEDPEYWGLGSRKKVMEVVRQEFSKSKIPITLLNITQLSEYRKDAHIAIYKKQWDPLTKEQIANPTSYADCVHWCLPGLQDTWNELLYTKLFHPYK